jgi:hypothetical protein
MTITPEKLTRAAGLSAALAGLLYVFIQFIGRPSAWSRP